MFGVAKPPALSLENATPSVVGVTAANGSSLVSGVVPTTSAKTPLAASSPLFTKPGYRRIVSRCVCAEQFLHLRAR